MKIKRFANWLSEAEDLSGEDFDRLVDLGLAKLDIRTVMNRFREIVPADWKLELLADSVDTELGNDFETVSFRYGSLSIETPNKTEYWKIDLRYDDPSFFIIHNQWNQSRIFRRGELSDSEWLEKIIEQSLTYMGYRS